MWEKGKWPVLLHNNAGADLMGDGKIMNEMTHREFWAVIMAKLRRSLETETVECSPEGPCGFEPLHLRQASGFAGGC